MKKCLLAVALVLAMAIPAMSAVKPMPMDVTVYYDSYREGLILRPMRGGHAEGVEVRLSAGAEGTLKPEVVNHETA